MRVRDIAELLGTIFEGDGSVEIFGVAPLESACASDIAFITGRKAKESTAGCLIVSTDFPNLTGRTLIRADQPRALFARVITVLHPHPKPVPGIHATAIIASDAAIDPSCTVGSHVTIGRHARIGARSSIAAGSVIGDNVSIGADCVVHANVTIYDQTEVGDRAILHAGCVLGADGFGFTFTGAAYEKFPQIGHVQLGNDVEIGANSCIDRAALGVTSIGDGAKLDNMVHIGHNCTIGKHVVIAAQTGLSGGVTVGDYAIIGGQVGIGDKARIESKAILGSGSGVLTSKIVRAGEPVWGVPARPLKQHLRQLATLARLSKRA